MAKVKPYPRVAPEVAGIQVNHCRNPTCRNFGVPALQTRGAIEGGIGSYLLTGGVGQSRYLTCHLCGIAATMYSNLAIAEEVARFDVVKRRLQAASCPNVYCSSTEKPIGTHPGLYLAHGRTASGEPRLRCRECGKTFSCGAPIRRQRRVEMNTPVLMHVVNKVPMRRICELLDLNPATLYNKIAYLSEVALQYMSRQEARIAAGEVRLARTYVSVDRQDHMLNWGSQLDRRNTTLGAIGAVDNDSGYAFAMQLNFDGDTDAQEIEGDAIERGDYDVPRVHRRYARLWLRRDYELAISQRSGGAAAALDPSEADLPFGKAPHSGMQVHLGVLYQGLFFHLKSLLQHVERTRFFLDLDPGLGNACLAGFATEIRERRCDAFLVRGGKLFTVDKKKLKVAQSNNELARFVRDNSIPEGESARRHFVMAKLKPFLDSHRSEKWFDYPLADMADPAKAVRHLTDFKDYDLAHLANLYAKASLRGVDGFFMQVRRRLSVLERPISTANNMQQRWHGYAAYSPVVAQQVLNIFRAYHNYCLIGDGKKTPAMRLGLTDAPVLPDVMSGATLISAA